MNAYLHRGVSAYSKLHTPSWLLCVFRLLQKILRKLQCLDKDGHCLHSKTPHVVTMLWLDSDDVVTILSPTSGTSGSYKTVYLCHLDSYTVTVCNRYLMSSNVVTVQLLTRYLVDRFLHRSHGSWYLITCVSDVVTVQQLQCQGLENSDNIVTVVVTRVHQTPLMSTTIFAPSLKVCHLSRK